jgi:hypothetical protein
MQTIEEIIEDFLKIVTTERPNAAVKEVFKNTKFEDLITYHHTLGQHIRNYYGLWETKWTPEIVDGVDMSPSHPDAISMHVIEEVWKRLQ